MANDSIPKSGDIEPLDTPHLALAGFDLWVHGYQFPDSTDRWDANWLRVTARCSASGADVSVEGGFLDTFAISRFHDQLRALYEHLEGEAELSTNEPDLTVRVIGTGHGRLAVDVEITPNYLSQQHAFQFEADQTYLPPAIAQCRAILARYPVRAATNSAV